MPSTKGISRKTTAMAVIIAMLVSAFSIMGLTAEEAHAAAKAKKPAKVTGFKVTQKSEVVTASWKKAKKVKVGKKKYALKYQLETTIVDVFGGKATKKVVYTGTKKSYTSHPGTKFTFRVRAFYTNKNGKKVYGKWTAKKSQTVKNTMNIKAECARVEENDNRVLAQAHVWGAKVAKYDTAVFEFNGQTKKCGIYDYVMFNNSKGGTIKAYAQYTAKNSKGKTKVIKTPYATCSVKAKSTTDPTSPTAPTGGGGTIVREEGERTYVESGTTTELKGAENVAAATPNNPYVLSDYTAIGDENYIDFGPVKNTLEGRANNKFIIGFTKDVQAKYNWYFYPTNNKVLVNTLSLTGNNAPVFNGELNEGEKYVSMKTNWQCTDGYIVGFEGNKEVYCKKLGWTTQVGYGIQAPGDVSINGPYYEKCKKVFQVVYKESGANKETSSAKKAQKIRDYLKDKTTYEVGNNSMNDLLGIGFFCNRDWLRGSSLLNINGFDYSGVLNMLLGLEGGSCQTFQVLETFVAKQIDSNAKVAHADLGETYENDHMAVDVDFSDGTYICLDMSSTMYGNRHVAGTAAGMYDYSPWRTYVKEALGDEACKFWFNF